MCRYLGAHRNTERDWFGDKRHSLRVITHADPGKAALWTFVLHPSRPRAMMMVLQQNLARTALDVRYWYLAVSDNPDAERDCVSMYLTVTDDKAKAATVEFVV